MDEWGPVFFVGLIIFVAYTFGTVLGFGSNVLAYPLVLKVKDIYFIRPMLTLFGFALNLSVFIKYHKHTNWRVFLTVVMLGGVGMLLGVYIYAQLNRHWLLLIVGIFVVYRSLSGIREVFFYKTSFVFPEWLMLVIVFFSGLFQGAISTGGTILVIYMAQKFKDKIIFRSTLATSLMFYTTVTCLQLFVFIPTGVPRPGREEWVFYMAVFPFLLTAIFLGQFLMYKIPKEFFRKLLFCMLLIGGINLIISGLDGII